MQKQQEQTQTQTYYQRWYKKNRKILLEKMKRKYSQDDQFQEKKRTYAREYWREKNRSRASIKDVRLPEFIPIKDDLASARAFYIDGKPVMLRNMNTLSQMLGYSIVSVRSWYYRGVLPPPTYLENRSRGIFWFDDDYILRIRKVLSTIGGRKISDMEYFKEMVRIEFEG
jgi:hypothetical protein